MSSYERQKKYRIFRRLASSSDEHPEGNDVPSSDISSDGNPVQPLPLTEPAQSSDPSINDSRSSSDFSEIQRPSTPDSLNEIEVSLSNDENLIINQEQNVQPTFSVKVQMWANKHIRNMTRDCLTDMLKLLKEEGYNFPI